MREEQEMTNLAPSSIRARSSTKGLTPWLSLQVQSCASHLRCMPCKQGIPGSCPQCRFFHAPSSQSSNSRLSFSLQSTRPLPGGCCTPLLGISVRGALAEHLGIPGVKRAAFCFIAFPLPGSIFVTWCVSVGGFIPQSV